MIGRPRRSAPLRSLQRHPRMYRVRPWSSVVFCSQCDRDRHVSEGRCYGGPTSLTIIANDFHPICETKHLVGESRRTPGSSAQIAYPISASAAHSESTV